MKAFHLDAENFADMQTKLEPQLEQLKIKQKDILDAELLVEEIFWRMVNKGKAAQVKVQVVKRLFGKVQVQMTAEGAPYSPLIELSDWDEDTDDEDYFSMMILKANRQKMNWLRKNNLNVITINVRSESNLQTVLTVAGIFGGLICGVLMREFLSPEAEAFICETIIRPPETMFLNALSLLIAPVIFFSVASGIIGMNAGANVGRIGSKLIGLYLCTSVLASIVGLSVAEFLFGNGVPQIGTIPTDAAVESYEFSMIKFIVDLIPADFVRPIAEGKILQIIFIAIFFGISINALGNKVAPLKELVGNLNDVFAKMMSMVMFFVPLIAFFAMTILALELEAEAVMIISKLIIVQLVAAPVLFGVFLIFIGRVGKISFKPFAKKGLALLPPAFATSSTSAVMSQMMNLCTGKLGVSPKISSFAVPLGASGLNCAGAMIYIITVCVMLLKMYGVELDLQTCALFAVLSVPITVSTPMVPAASVICIVTIAACFGVPNDVAALIFCLDALSDRIATCMNVLSNMTATTTLARTENLLDEKIYFEE